MNTVLKGNSFEDKVFDIFETQLRDGSFYLKKEFCKVFKKKGYFSKDREKDIIFDVSIEVTIPGQSRYSLLFLIECKNYNHSVPVDDLEEFFSKIQQVSGANIKGILVSTNAFQSGAFKYATSKGIGLLRYFDKDKIEWTLPRSPFSMAQSNWDAEEFDTRQALSDEDYQSRVFDLYGYVNETYTVSSRKYFDSLMNSGEKTEDIYWLGKFEQKSPEPQILVPYLDADIIEKVANAILIDANYYRGPVSLESISTLLRERFGLTIEPFAKLRPGILGDISFSTNVIRLDSSQALSPQMTRFTLSHEIGHLLLEHGRYILHEACHLDDIDFEVSAVLGLKDISRMEWQANFFASCLLLPKEQFISEFLDLARLYDLNDRGHGFIYLDEQRCNIEIFQRVTTKLMKAFDVSRSVVQIRLTKLGFLNDVRKISEFSFHRKINL